MVGGTCTHTKINLYGSSKPIVLNRWSAAIINIESAVNTRPGHGIGTKRVAVIDVINAHRRSAGQNSNVSIIEEVSCAIRSTGAGDKKTKGIIEDGINEFRIFLRA